MPFKPKLRSCNVNTALLLQAYSFISLPDPKKVSGISRNVPQVDKQMDFGRSHKLRRYLKPLRQRIRIAPFRTVQAVVVLLHAYYKTAESAE